MEKYFYTYVLRSKLGGKFYIGWTLDLHKRFKEHNTGKLKATKSRMPFELVYFEACLSKQKAIAREKSLKAGFGRKYIKTRI